MAQQEDLWPVTLKTTKYWSFPRSPLGPTMSLISTMNPVRRAKTTVSSSQELIEAQPDEPVAAKKVDTVSS